MFFQRLHQIEPDNPDQFTSSQGSLESLAQLKQALAKSHQNVPGYLSFEEISHVCETYNVSYGMNISLSQVHSAINQANAIDPIPTGLINIGLFCRFLDDGDDKLKVR